ncbi:hypothetical protein [Kitasatospora sp. MBT63]|uniref:hypothetical protein n=1 Tax=Kitasatospora sp. MBT63 TaxID=1444768 RepID=UPI00053B7A8D|nr:hypothetical protein [Kitasatospora sp. MBT63]
MTDDRLPSAANYPVPEPEAGEDPRFTRRLIFDVARLIEDAGFPPISAGRDLVRLMEALYAFCYSDAPR